MMKKRYHIISLMVLFVIGFLFLHSELDLFSPEHHIHGSHDFCDIVESAKTENPSISKFKVNIADVPLVILPFEFDLARDFYNARLYNPHLQYSDVDINILHSTFLI